MWDAFEPGQHSGLQSIWQHGQNVQLAAFTQRADDRDKVAMARAERNLINAQSCQRRERIPVNTPANPAVEDAQKRISGNILFGFDIAKGAIDEKHDQMAFVGLGVQRLGVVPVKRLCGGGMVVAIGTAEALGSDA